jgi:hypothetical protein
VSPRSFLHSTSLAAKTSGAMSCQPSMQWDEVCCGCGRFLAKMMIVPTITPTMSTLTATRFGFRSMPVIGHAALPGLSGGNRIARLGANTTSFLSPSEYVPKRELIPAVRNSLQKMQRFGVFSSR